MFKILSIYLLSISNVLSKPDSVTDVENKPCCKNINLDSDFIELNSEIMQNNKVLNFNCSDLTVFGKDKCNAHKICNWKFKCKRFNKKCKRTPKYEYHFGKIVDVGSCSGLCKKNNNCYPNNYGEVNINDNIVKIIKDCDCDTCGVIQSSKLVEIPVGICHGDCNTEQVDTECNSGLNDNFNPNNLELSNPSTNLINGILSQCSAGIQSGFDIFIDNRCFGHTFNCIKNKPCNLKSAYLEICMQAANVPLTNTDSLILGTYGSSLWGLGLPTLNGGTWNPGEQLCLNLDLNNLPSSGFSIINDIFIAGHLDVVVQDDTAVDFVNLKLFYEKCNKCLEVSSVVNVLYTSNGMSEHKEITDCDCIRQSDCSLMEHMHTFYPGTIYENTINVGQCFGTCDVGKCKSVDYSEIKMTDIIKD